MIFAKIFTFGGTLKNTLILSFHRISKIDFDYSRL